MSRAVVCCCCLLTGAVALATCGCAAEEPDDAAAAFSIADEPTRSTDPASWSCQRYGDVADRTGDSFDLNAVREAEQYLVESVTAALGERGIEPEVGDEPPDRWTGLLSEICAEWPDLVLEAAVGRVAEGLP